MNIIKGFVENRIPGLAPYNEFKKESVALDSKLSKITNLINKIEHQLDSGMTITRKSIKPMSSEHRVELIAQVQVLKMKLQEICEKKEQAIRMAAVGAGCQVVAQVCDSMVPGTGIAVGVATTTAQNVYKGEKPFKGVIKAGLEDVVYGGCSII